jgi:hypothetical protein
VDEVSEGESVSGEVEKAFQDIADEIEDSFN